MHDFILGQYHVAILLYIEFGMISVAISINIVLQFLQYI